MEHYLGDGAYIEEDAAGRIVLFTHNGYSRTNNIVLEDEVLLSLKQFLQGCGKW